MLKKTLSLVIISLIVTTAFAQKNKLVKTSTEDVSLLKLSFQNGNWNELNRLLATNAKTTDSTFVALQSAYSIMNDTLKNKYVYIINKQKPKCVSINGAESVDLKNPNVTYVWTMPNGEEKEGLVVTHCFADTGMQQVKLTFKDNSSDMKFIDDTILNIHIQMPQANVTGGNIQGVNTTKQYEANSVYGNDAEYVWDTKDDKYYTGKIAKIKYEREGVYRLTCFIKNKSNASSPILVVEQKIAVTRSYVRGSTIVSTVNEHYQEKTGTVTK